MVSLRSKLLMLLPLPIITSPPETCSFVKGFVVPIPTLPVEGLYVNVLLVLTDVIPEVVSTKVRYLVRSDVSEDTERLDAAPVRVPVILLT